MPFEEVLARCIAAMERGATIRDCVTRYPDHAKALELLLQTVEQLRASPPPRLSAEAFERGREAVRARARYHQRVAEPFFVTRATPHANHGVQIVPDVRPAPALPTHARPPRWKAPLIGRWSNLLTSILVVLTVITTSRNVTNSLPGSELYPVKNTVEQLYGYFMSAAGQEALWHARQVERRLRELDRLAQQGATDPALVTAVEHELQQALASSATLPPDERQAFYARWLTDLRAVQPGPDAANTTVITLGRVLSTVEAAADAPLEPQILQSATPTLAPTMTSDAAVTASMPSPTPTDPSTDNILGQPSATAPAGRVNLPTVTPTQLPTVAPTSLQTIAAPTATPLPPVPTATPLPPVPTATNTPTPNPAPADEDDEKDQHNSAPAPTATPLPPVATNTEAPTAEATVSSSPPTVQTVVTLTPRPEATRTATPTTALSTATETKTDLPTATATPVAIDTRTPTAEPTETLSPTDTTTPSEETPVATATDETPEVTPSATERPTWPPRTSEPPTPFTATPEPPTPDDTPTAEPSPTEEEPTPAPSETPTDEPTLPGETPTPDETTPIPEDQGVAPNLTKD